MDLCSAVSFVTALKMCFHISTLVSVYCLHYVVFGSLGHTFVSLGSGRQGIPLKSFSIGESDRKDDSSFTVYGLFS